MTAPGTPLPVVFLFGQTAVGKTAILQRLPAQSCEIISADSLQVYRGLDIGTAKPPVELRRELPHHLIDILDPRQRFDVGEFVRRADEAIHDVIRRGRMAVVSGGAGFYLRNLLYGLPTAPSSTPEVRSRVRKRLEQLGLDALYDELSRVDPETALRIGPRDEYRITRALEVYELSGRPLSAFPPPAEPRDDLRACLISVERPRAELVSRINDRVADMFSAGLRAEVEELVRAGYRPTDPGLRGIGYAEFFDKDGEIRPAGDDKIVGDAIRLNTRRYAKRQATFFRGLPGVARIRADSVAAIVAKMQTHWESHQARA